MMSDAKLTTGCAPRALDAWAERALNGLPHR